MNDKIHDTNDSYLEERPLWHSERSQWKAEQVVSAISKAGIEPKSICDIGCGTGLALKIVKDMMPCIKKKPIGYEPSVHATVHVEAENMIDFRRCGITSIDENFDVALMLDVFEHVDDYIGFLREAKEISTYHVFHIPLDVTISNVLRTKLLGSRKSVGHLHYFTAASAIATLEYVGYKVLYKNFTCAGWQGAGKNPVSPVNIARRALYKISPELLSLTIGGVSLIVVAG